MDDEFETVPLVRISVLYNDKKYGTQYQVLRAGLMQTHSEVELDRLNKLLNRMTQELMDKIRSENA